MSYAFKSLPDVIRWLDARLLEDGEEDELGGRSWEGSVKGYGERVADREGGREREREGAREECARKCRVRARYR